MENIETAWENYSTAVASTAQQMFEDKVKPILERRGWVLMQIQRDWRFGPGENHADLLYGRIGWSGGDENVEDPDAIELLQILCTEIPGMPCEDLGCLMPDTLDRDND